MHNNIDYSTTKAISNSALGMMKISPKAFLKFYNQELEEENTKFFRDGSAIHCYILEPEEFKNLYVFKDISTPNSPNKKKFVEEYIKSKKLIKSFEKSYSVDSLKEDAKKQKATELKEELKDYIESLELEKKGITILPTKFKGYLNNIKKALEDHFNAKDLLFKTPHDFEQFAVFNEHPIFWKVKIEDSEYDMKALLDRFIIDFKQKKIYLIDLKTTSKIHDFKSSLEQFEYDRQLAFYTLAIMEMFKQEYPKENIEEYDIEHYIVAVSKENEPECRVFKISKDRILNASKNISDLLNRIHWHFSNNKFDRTKEQYTEGYEIL